MSSTTTTSSQTPESVGVSLTGSPRPRRRGAGRVPGDRERHMQAWRDRRQAVQTLAAQDARLRVRRYGPSEAVRDAAAALAHPSAEPWQDERELLAAAASSASADAVVANARNGARKAAGDAARGGARAPDADMALATATAFKVIQFAPRYLLHLYDRERPGTTRPATVSALRR